MAALRWLGCSAAAVAAFAVAGGCTGDRDTDAATTATERATAVTITCELRRLPFSRDVDLTGAWRDDAGAIVYVRQIGDAIWWSAMHGAGGLESELGARFTPVGRGRIRGRTTFAAEWADVPRGRDLNWGEIVFRIVETPDGSTTIREQIDAGLPLVAVVLGVASLSLSAPEGPPSRRALAAR